MSTKSQIQELSTAEVVSLPWSSVQSKYSGQMAEIIDDLQKSAASTATKSLPPQKIRWYLACQRAEDPPQITDPEAFRGYLAANSQVYLKAVADRWIGYAVIDAVPAHFMAQFEQRAKWITDHRKRESEASSGAMSVLFQPDHEPQPERPNALLEALENWLEAHDHDRRLAQVARVALEQLADSGGN